MCATIQRSIILSASPLGPSMPLLSLPLDAVATPSLLGRTPTGREHKKTRPLHQATYRVLRSQARCYPLAAMEAVFREGSPTR